jgi:hypothetical protein
MFMKGMSATLWIVVSALVLVIVAIVVLTIFGTGMGPFSTITDFKNNCITQGKATCASSGFLPLSWDRKVRVGNEDKSCADVVEVPGAREDNPCGDWAVGGSETSPETTPEESGGGGTQVTPKTEAE